VPSLRAATTPPTTPPVVVVVVVVMEVEVMVMVQPLGRRVA